MKLNNILTGSIAFACGAGLGILGTYIFIKKKNLNLEENLAKEYEDIYAEQTKRYEELKKDPKVYNSLTKEYVSTNSEDEEDAILDSFLDKFCGEDEVVVVEPYSKPIKEVKEKKEVKPSNKKALKNKIKTNELLAEEYEYKDSIGEVEMWGHKTETVIIDNPYTGGFYSTREFTAEDEKELKQYIIPVEKYEDDSLRYDKKTLCYFTDGILIDEEDGICDDIDGTVGEDNLTKFGEKSNESDILYVRNHDLATDYEIMKIGLTYKDWSMSE